MIDQKVLRDRTKYFTIEIVKFIKGLSLTYEDRIIIRQLLRSASSMAANYRAAGRSRSKAEFFAKICIVLEEADETLFWLEIVSESGITDLPETRKLEREAFEFVKIFSTTRKNLKRN